MGRRNGGRPLFGTLRRRLDSCKSRYTTVDDIVNHLRSTYPDYQRTKQQALTRLVQQVLEPRAKPAAPKVSPTRRVHDDDEDDDEEGGRSAPRRRRNTIDQGEERLQKMEALHLRKRMQGEEEAQGSASTSSASSSSASGSSGSEEEEDDDDDEAVSMSTSEDAIYGEKYEPAFDLMKTMLRNKYTPKKDDNVRKKKPVVEDKNVELEVANNSKVTNELCAVNGGRGRGEAKAAVKDVNSKGSVSNGTGGGGSDVELKQKTGPRFSDLGGMQDVLEELMEVIVPLYRSELPRELGVTPTTGILLHGPPGCGKTTLAHAIANETGLPFYQISATELVSGVSGASEENIRELFTKAYRTAPSIVFIDEIDSIASKRDNLQREMEKRIVTQLLVSMDQSSSCMQSANDSDSSKVHSGHVLVIGATNRPDALDPALRRPGRFDREIVVGIPDESSREHILTMLTRNLKLEGSLDLKHIARSTPGYVSADLVAVVKEAGNLAIKRILSRRKWELSQGLTRCLGDWWKEPWSHEDVDKLFCTMSDFQEAVKKVQPSLRREGFSSVPNVKWEDVGGLDCLKEEFESSIIRPIKYPEVYQTFEVVNETGILLFGPPGCGKTLIAKAVANEAGANFIHIKGPELLNKFVGESEREVRRVFSRARACSPCIVFFDEVDALSTKRDSEGGSVVERVVNQLLIELNGGDQRQGVFVIGATNRPDVMDEALLRSGRLGKFLYVPVPNADQRFSILKALARKKPADSTVDLRAIAEACENFSGADLAALMNEAAKAAVNEKLTSVEATSDTNTYMPRHFEIALTKVSPSVSPAERRRYERLAERFKVS
ncbi:cell division control protein 48 homolog C [Arachis duranensis]|uniref:Cell division control protein 48 homolog C n=1 Tax=Arachis duranensis TaxID=130453 RepID=A0A6P4C0B1_ARADU|nr:cell division control protein 48 homolog C [Arachis duranensis]